MASNRHSLRLEGGFTSISIDVEFWDGLKEIAQSRGVSISSLISEIDKARSAPNLSSALRVFVVEYFAALSREEKPSTGG